MLKFLHVIWKVILSLGSPFKATVIDLKKQEIVKISCDEGPYFPIRLGEPTPIFEIVHIPGCKCQKED